MKNKESLFSVFPLSAASIALLQSTSAEGEPAAAISDDVSRSFGTSTALSADKLLLSPSSTVQWQHGLLARGGHSSHSSHASHASHSSHSSHTSGTGSYYGGYGYPSYTVPANPPAQQYQYIPAPYTPPRSIANSTNTVFHTNSVPFLFTIESVHAWPLFVHKLKARTEPMAAFLYDDSNKFMRESLALYTESNSVPYAVQSEVISALNSTISGPLIFDSKRFEGVKLRPRTQELLTQGVQGDQLISLNRMLIEDAFPLEFLFNTNSVATDSHTTINTNVPVQVERTDDEPDNAAAENLYTRGMQFLNGTDGVQKDLPRARMYFQLAVKKNSTKAKEVLEELDSQKQSK